MSSSLSVNDQLPSLVDSILEISLIYIPLLHSPSDFKYSGLYYSPLVYLASLLYSNFNLLAKFIPLTLARFIVFCFLFLIYFWLHRVFVAVCGLSLVAASGGYSLSQCTGFSLRWLLLLRSTGSRHAGSVVVARGL